MHSSSRLDPSLSHQVLTLVCTTSAYKILVLIKHLAIDCYNKMAQILSKKIQNSTLSANLHFLWQPPISMRAIRRTPKGSGRAPCSVIPIKQAHFVLWNNALYGIFYLVWYLELEFIARLPGSKLCRLQAEADGGEWINVVAVWNVVQLPGRIMFVCLWHKCERNSHRFQKCESTFLYLTLMNTFFCILYIWGNRIYL